MPRQTFFLFLFFTTIWSQERGVLIQNDSEQIILIINSITQGIKQHRLELILPYMSYQLKDFDDKILSETEKREKIERFFFSSTNRKNNKSWKENTPSKDLPSNWDFEIDSPTVLINGDEATANFTFYWITDIPLVQNSTIIELKQPSKKIPELWNFKKENNEWKLVKTRDLFRIMKLVAIGQ